MFLRNDYFYTVINETPFRFVLKKQIFGTFDVSRKLEISNAFLSLTVWVLS